MAKPEGNTLGWAARGADGQLSPFRFNRREVAAKDVEFEIKFCGICHSDYHTLHNEWGSTVYPIVTGHELAGVVTKVGSEVTKFTVGQHVGVGCMVGSCRSCDSCNVHLEQFCPQVKFTYNSVDYDGSVTQGGYSERMVCHEDFVLSIPDKLPLDAAAPLMCAGITVYSPMAHYGMTQKGAKLGVVGLGGLGHMAVRFGKKFGLDVTVLSTSPNKQKEALEVLKADHFVVTKDPEQMKALAGKLDYIIDTVSANHDIPSYLALLKADGKMALVGVPPEPLKIMASSLIFGRKLLGGSLIGGMKETQEMLDFCAEHDVLPLIEKIPFSYINTAMERLHKQDVKYRFVLDISTIRG